MRRVCSLDVAQVMIEQKHPLTITQLVEIMQKRDANTVISRAQVSSIVRNFVESPGCCCVAYKNTYPHKYHLLSVENYTFKIRKNNPIDRNSFQLYVTQGTPRIAREHLERKERLISEMSRQFASIMNNVRMRHTAQHSATC